MPDTSILEFFVYGFITYSSLLMLIISTVKDVPSEKSGSIVRGIWLIPGIICAFLLASAGPNIIIQDNTNTITSVNTTEVWVEENHAVFELQNPIWVSVHLLIMLILIVYVALQMLTLFTKIT